MNRLLLSCAALLALPMIACKPEAAPPNQPSGSRYDAVLAQPKPVHTFCEKVYPAEGPDARKLQLPPTQPLPVHSKLALNPNPTGWTWVNLWATWCEPCRDEMTLLGRWREALGKDGAPLELNLLSVDATENGPALGKAITRGLPGPTTWLASEETLAPFLEKMLGIDKEAALPIHALVDPRGNLRCVRVGAVHASDYGAIKALVSQK